MLQSDGRRIFLKILTLGVLVFCLGLLSYGISGARLANTYTGQASVQAPIISVVPQTDVPLRISSVRFEEPSQGAPEIFFSITNLSDKAISAYAIRQDVRAGAKSMSSTFLIDLDVKDSSLQPGQTAERFDTVEPLSGGAHNLSLSVDYVEFADGTKWGSDSFKFAEQLAGQRAGAREAINQFVEILNASGPDAVLKTIDLDTVKPTPPAGHSAKWVEGFNLGVEAISIRLKNASKKGGLSQVERLLRQSAARRKGGA
jgi:hypothetical protein